MAESLSVIILSSTESKMEDPAGISSSVRDFIFLVLNFEVFVK